MYRTANPKIHSNSTETLISHTNSDEYRTSFDENFPGESDYHRPLAIATRLSTNSPRTNQKSTVSPPAINLNGYTSPPSTNHGFTSPPNFPSTLPSSDMTSRYRGYKFDFLRDQADQYSNSLTKTSPKHPLTLDLNNSSGLFDFSPSSLQSSPLNDKSSDSFLAKPLSLTSIERTPSPAGSKPLPTIPSKSSITQSPTSQHSPNLIAPSRPLPTPPVKKSSTQLHNVRYRAQSDASAGTLKKAQSLDKSIINSQGGLRSPLSPNSFPEFPQISGMFISEVVERFLFLIPRQTHTKNSLEYQNSFSGKDIIDTLCLILDNTDRKLGLEYGKCLENQKLFHDVTFESSLKDTPYEIYNLKDFFNLASTSIDASFTKEGESTTSINGVFTSLTPCYSISCNQDSYCYSPTCPYKPKNKFFNFKSISTVKLISSLPEPMRVWASSVPKHILDTTPIREKKRQEAIFEFIYTEKDFVEDLELLQEFFIKPLQYENIIPIEMREAFVEEVFFNVMEIYSINSALSQALFKRQELNYVVEKIGDIFLDHVQNFEPFVAYGAHQLFAKQSLDFEISHNPLLAKYLEDQEHRTELRKLPIQSFMGRPTTRLAKYSLLLDAIIKYTEDDNPDKANLKAAISIIRGFLNRINAETGKADNKLKLARINKLIAGNSNELRQLNLLSEKRQLIRDGLVKKKTGVDQVELTIFLFDHFLLLTKKKSSKEADGFTYKIHKKPIPLEMVKVSIPDDLSSTALATRRSSNGFVSRRANSLLSMGAANQADANYKSGFAFNLTHLGRDGLTITLYAATMAERKQWKDKIEKQRSIVTGQTSVFEMVTLSDVYFKNNNKVTCSAVYEKGEKILIGTDAGIYLIQPGYKSRVVKVIDLDRVTQIEVLEEYNMFIVLADRYLYTFAMDTLSSTSDTALKNGRKISSHVTFFKVGVCLGRVLVCVVKATPLTSVVKALEPVLLTFGKKSSFGKFLMRAGKDGMRLFKKFYIPAGYTSLHFLKTKICVGCAKGFEIVDLDTLNTQGLLDETDPSLNFVVKREVVKPISIYRVQNRDFLLCYDEFAFFVDKDGRRSRLDFIIMWEGEPSSFAFEYPYIMGFNFDFIEVWHVELGKLVQVIPTGNSRSLSTGPNAIHCVSNPNLEYQHVFALRLKISK